MITDYMLTNKHAHALNGNFGPFAIPAWILWNILGGLVIFYYGVKAGDKDWPWEHQHTGDEDDNTFIPELPLPKALGGLLILGALILGATLLTGRGK